MDDDRLPIGPSILIWIGTDLALIWGIVTIWHQVAALLRAAGM